MSFRMLFTAALLLILCACDNINEVPYKGTFVNESALTLTISPDGQDWKPFELAPGHSRDVSLGDKELLFTVSPTNVVWMFDADTSTVTFYDRDPNSDDDTLYCPEGATACDGTDTIYKCEGGFWRRYLCAGACVDAGYAVSIGCGYSSNAGRDQCFCE